MSRSTPRPSRRSGARKAARQPVGRQSHASAAQKPPVCGATLADIFGEGLHVERSDVDGQYIVAANNRVVGCVIRYQEPPLDSWAPLHVFVYELGTSQSPAQVLAVPDPRKAIVDAFESIDGYYAVV